MYRLRRPPLPVRLFVCLNGTTYSSVCDRVGVFCVMPRPYFADHRIRHLCHQRRFGGALVPVHRQKQAHPLKIAATVVLSVVPPRSPANPAVVLAAALGLRTVEMSATQSSITPGSRASRPAKVLRRRFPLKHHYKSSSVAWELLSIRCALGSHEILLSSRRICISLVVRPLRLLGTWENVLD